MSAGKAQERTERRSGPRDWSHSQIVASGWGADDPGVMKDIYGAGYYLTIMWTCDSYGWKQWTPAEIIQHCYEETGQGGIVLMHVGSDGTDQDALPGLVDEFSADGYDFVTVAEVLAPAEDDDR